MADTTVNNRRLALILINIMLAVLLVVSGVFVFVMAQAKDADPTVLQPKVYIAEDAAVKKVHTGREGEPAGYFHVEAVADDSVTISGNPEIAEGAVIVGGISKPAPSGFLRRVTGVETQGARTVFTTKPAALDEAIKTCNVAVKYVLTSQGDFEPVRERKNSAAGSDLLATPAYATAAEGNLLNLESKDGNVKLNAGLTMDVQLQIGESGTHFKLVNNLEGDLSVDWKDFQVENELFSTSKTGTTMVGPLPLVWENDFSINLSARARGEGGAKPLDVKVNRLIGFKYDSGKGLSKINTDNSKAELFEPAGDTTMINLNEGLNLGFNNRFLLYKMAGPSLILSLDQQLNAELQKAQPGYPKNTLVTLGDKNFQGMARYKVTFPLSGEFILQPPDFNPFSGEDSAKLLETEIFNTGDSITLIDWRQPEFNPDFMREFDLTNIRLPYDNNYLVQDPYATKLAPNPACPFSFWITQLGAKDLPTMPDAPDECWKTVVNGESTEKWENELVPNLAYLIADIGSTTYADFNDDGFLDVSFTGAPQIPTVTGPGVIFLLIANPADPKHPYVAELAGAMQADLNEWTFYKGGLFTQHESDGEDIGTTNYRFVTKPGKLTIELTQQTGTQKIAKLW